MCFQLLVVTLHKAEQTLQALMSMVGVEDSAQSSILAGRRSLSCLPSPLGCDKALLTCMELGLSIRWAGLHTGALLIRPSFNRSNFFKSDLGLGIGLYSSIEGGKNCLQLIQHSFPCP